MENKRPSILCVDDDPLVLAGIKEFLGRNFSVHTAPSAEEGLVCLELDGPFTTVVSDLEMPGMDGIAFLGRARKMCPDTSRILLTGAGDLNVAAKAVNQGHIFRFLTKPCPIVDVIAAVKDATEQYRLVTAERILLEQTLHQSVKALTDVLALSSPVTFGRALRAKKYASELATFFGVKDRWQIEVAAMLSQVGCITLPLPTLEKLYHGQRLTDWENETVEQLPAIARQLFGGIPRLDEVVDVLVYQAKRFDGGGAPHDSVKGTQIPWGARALKIALDYDVLETEGLRPTLAVDTLRGRTGCYDPEILEAFGKLRGTPAPYLEVRELSARDLSPGMTFASDVRTANGTVLVARGQEVTESLARRIQDLPNVDTAVGLLRVITRIASPKGTGSLNEAVLARS